MNNKVLAIDIGNKNIKLVVGKTQKSTVIVEKAVTIETPKNSYKDGEILELEDLKDAIEDILDDEKIKVKKVICTVQSTAIITREITLPIPKKEDEFDTMIRFEIEQYLPIMLDDYVVEYKILERFKEEELEKARILVAALPRKIAERYFDLIEELKLKPIALDINSNAISKLFDKEIDINKSTYGLYKTIGVIDIGHSDININIISNGAIEFNRLVDIGSSEIDINIANMSNMSLDEAEDKKIKDINLEIEYLNEDIQITTQILNDAVKSSIDIWIQEIKRIFQYYSNRKLGNTIDEIYIYGGGSNIRGLESYFKEHFGIPTFKIENMSNIKANQELIDIGLPFFLNSIGAIIRK